MIFKQFIFLIFSCTFAMGASISDASQTVTTDESFKYFKWLPGTFIPTPKEGFNDPLVVESKSYKIIVVCGNKGSGKTTTLAKMKDQLDAAGFFVKVVAIFQEANAIFAKSNGSFGMFTRSAEDALHAELELRRINEHALNCFIAELKASEKSKGVLLMDRGWLTVLGSLDEAHPDLSHRDRIRLWDEYWKDQLRPTFFIETKPENTKIRRHGQLDIMSGLPTPESVDADYARRLELIGRFKPWIIGHYDTSSEIDTTRIATDAVGKICYKWEM